MKKSSRGVWIRRGLIAAAVIGVIVFLFTRGSGRGADGKYTSDVNHLRIFGREYVAVTDIMTEETIGSKVRALVYAEHGERAGSVRTLGIFTIAALYRVKGDTEDLFLVDSSERIYVRASEAEKFRAILADDASFSEYRIVNSVKKPPEVKSIPKEQMQILQELTGEETTVTDKLAVANYSNRREILGYTKDGMFRKPLAELFLYNNTVYLTTSFIGDRDINEYQELKGRALPEEWQTVFREYWK